MTGINCWSLSIQISAVRGAITEECSDGQNFSSKCDLLPGLIPSPTPRVRKLKSTLLNLNCFLFCFAFHSGQSSTCNPPSG